MERYFLCTDDRRFIGNGVTWRGTFCGTVVGTFVGGLLGFIGAIFGDLTQLTYGVIGIHAYGSIIAGFGLGFLMAFGALAGDAAGSFLKRRLGLQSGDPAPFLDQLDFVCGALVLSLLVVPLTLDFVLLIMAISIVLKILSIIHIFKLLNYFKVFLLIFYFLIFYLLVFYLFYFKEFTY